MSEECGKHNATVARFRDFWNQIIAALTNSWSKIIKLDVGYMCVFDRFLEHIFAKKASSEMLELLEAYAEYLLTLCCWEMHRGLVFTNLLTGNISTKNFTNIFTESLCNMI